MKTSRLCFLALFFSLIFIFESGFLVIGHRGNPSKYPEETIQSDNSAFADGADYVELDLHVSKDNVLVVSHDRDLSRVVGSSVIVSQNNFSYLNTLKQANGESIISKINLTLNFCLKQKKLSIIVLKIWKNSLLPVSRNTICKIE